jgi:hypothetical protein
MPVMQRFACGRVAMYPKDHTPAHFHVVLNDGREAWVAIATLEILRGKVMAREIAEVLAWAKVNQAWLAERFEELQQ